jgi:hypothetical protein
MALYLIGALVASGTVTRSTAGQDAERQSREVIEDAIADAEEVLNLCLGPHAPQSLLDFFTSHQPVK